MLKNGDEVTARVYCLKHDGVPIYVGCTTRSFEERLNQHYIKGATSEGTQLYQYLNNKQGVSIELIEEVKYKFDERIGHVVGNKLESYWINQYKMMGYGLYNTRIVGSKPAKTVKTRPIRPVKEAVVSNIPHIIDYKSENDKTRKQTGLNLRQARKNSSLTQQMAAYKLGIKRALLGAYEEGRAQASVAILYKAMEVYGVSDINEFIKGQITFPFNNQQSA